MDANGLPLSHARRTAFGAVGATPPGTTTAAGVARDLEENHVRDRDAERPVLSEMAEKLRRARSAGFHDFEGEPQTADAPPVERPAEPVGRSEVAAEKARPHDDRDEGSGAGSLQASLRLDSIERRLFDLRAALDELAAGQTDMLLDAEAHAPTDAEAWIAFAAAAVRRSDDVEEGAAIADRLLARVPQAASTRRSARRRGVAIAEGRSS